VGDVWLCFSPGGGWGGGRRGGEGPFCSDGYRLLFAFVCAVRSESEEVLWFRGVSLVSFC